MILIDKYYKIGLEEFEKSLKELIGKENVDMINKTINMNVSNEKILNKLKKVDLKSEELKNEIE